MPAWNLNENGCTYGCGVNGTPGTDCPLGPSLVNYQRTDSYKVWDLVNKLCQTPLLTCKWVCKYWQYASLPYLMFTYSDYTNAAWGVNKILQFKNIPQYTTLTETGYSVKWWETVESFPECFADGDQVNTNVIKVSSADNLRKFFKNDMVTIYATDYNSNNPQDTASEGHLPDGFNWSLNHEGTDGKQDENAEGNKPLTAQKGDNPHEPENCCQLELRAKITNIDPVNLEITFNIPVTVKNGDRILRDYHLIASCERFETGAALEPTDYFESFYQYFGWTLTFTQEELNKCYATPNGPHDYVNAKFEALYKSLFLDVGNAFWKGLNVKEIQGVQEAQTMGILPAIYREAANGKNIIHDLRNKTSDIAKVRALLAIFEDAQQCIIEGIDQTLVVAGNNKFWTALTKLNPAWQSYAACMPICDEQNEVSFKVKNINTVYGRVEFYTDFFLQYYYPNKSFAVVMPKGLTSMWMPEYERLSVSNGSSIMFDNVVPGFKVEDLNILNVGKLGCPTTIQISTRFALIHAGMRSGCWRIIEGLY